MTDTNRERESFFNNKKEKNEKKKKIKIGQSTSNYLWSIQNAIICILNVFFSSSL